MPFVNTVAPFVNTALPFVHAAAPHNSCVAPFVHTSWCPQESNDFLLYAEPSTQLPDPATPSLPISAVSAADATDATSLTLIMEPFPTIYWLTNPSLKRAISIVEDNHRGIPTLEKKMTPADVAR